MRGFRIRTCSQGGWPPGRAPGQLRPRCRPLHQTARAHRPCRVHTHSTTGSRLNSLQWSLHILTPLAVPSGGPGLRVEPHGPISPGQLPSSMPVENPSVRPRSRKRACYGLSRLRTGEAAEAPHRSVRVVTIVGCGFPPSMPVENPAAVNSSVRPPSRKRACYGLSRLRTGEAAEAPHRSVRVVTIVGCGFSYVLIALLLGRASTYTSPSEPLQRLAGTPHPVPSPAWSRTRNEMVCGPTRGCSN